MNASINLLDKYKKVCAITSDNACAISLGISRSAVSLWRKGKGHPEADSIERMCKAAGEPIAKWLPLIEAERARTPEAKKVWLRMAHIASAITLLVAINLHSSNAYASTETGSHNPGTVYIMSNYARLLRWLGTALAWLFSINADGTHGAHSQPPALAL